MEANFYTQNHSTINGRNIWLYLISCPIGNIYIVEYEKQNLELNRFLINESLQKAEKMYDNICVKIIKGTA